MTSDIPPVSNSVPARGVESNSNDHTLTALPHTTTGRQPSNTHQYLELMSVDMFQHARVVILVFDREPSSDIPRGQQCHSFLFGIQKLATDQRSSDLILRRQATYCEFQTEACLSGTRCSCGDVRAHSDTKCTTRTLDPSGQQVVCERRKYRESFRRSVVIYISSTICTQDL